MNAIRVMITEIKAAHAIATTSFRLKAMRIKFIPRGSYILTPSTEHPAMNPINVKMNANLFTEGLTNECEKLNIIPSKTENAAK